MTTDSSLRSEAQTAAREGKLQIPRSLRETRDDNRFLAALGRAAAAREGKLQVPRSLRELVMTTDSSLRSEGQTAARKGNCGSLARYASS